MGCPPPKGLTTDSRVSLLECGLWATWHQKYPANLLLTMQIPRLHPRSMDSEPLERANPGWGEEGAPLHRLLEQGPLANNILQVLPLSSLGWRWGEGCGDCDSVSANDHHQLP